MLRRRAALFLVLPALVASTADEATRSASAYPSGYEPESLAAARALRNEEWAARLVSRAVDHVQARRKRCSYGSIPDEAAPRCDAPSQAFLGVLAPLRRPAGPGEAHDEDHSLLPTGRRRSRCSSRVASAGDDPAVFLPRTLRTASRI